MKWGNWIAHSSKTYYINIWNLFQVVNHNCCYLEQISGKFQVVKNNVCSNDEHKIYTCEQIGRLLIRLDMAFMPPRRAVIFTYCRPVTATY